MRVLVACESSGVVRRAFAYLGHDAWSADLLPAEDGSNKHYTGDARDILHEGWDLLMVAHPPCTRLCNSGVRWLTEPPQKLSAEHYTKTEIATYHAMSREERLEFMWAKLDEGAELFSDFWNAPIERIAVENPVMHGYAKSRIRNYQAPAQIVQPWWFGEPQFKATGLYLRKLKPLVPTNKLIPPKPGTALHREWSKVHRASPGPNRWRDRSRFLPGIAAAMAEQWGGERMTRDPTLYGNPAPELI